MNLLITRFKVWFFSIIFILIMFSGCARNRFPIEIASDAIYAEQIIDEIRERYTVHGDYEIMRISAILDRDGYGEWSIALKEKKRRKPHILEIRVNTREHIIFDASFYDYHTKIDEGVLPDFMISSSKALQIAKKFLPCDKTYDGINISTISDLYRDTPCWNVMFFTDNENSEGVDYFLGADIDIVSGEVIRKSFAIEKLSPLFFSSNGDMIKE